MPKAAEQQKQQLDHSPWAVGGRIHLAKIRKTIRNYRDVHKGIESVHMASQTLLETMEDTQLLAEGEYGIQFDLSVAGAQNAARFINAVEVFAEALYENRIADEETLDLLILHVNFLCGLYDHKSGTERPEKIRQAFLEVRENADIRQVPQQSWIGQVMADMRTGWQRLRGR